MRVVAVSHDTLMIHNGKGIDINTYNSLRLMLYSLKVKDIFPKISFNERNANSAHDHGLLLAWYVPYVDKSTF